MTRDEHLMTIVMEECNEVAQRVSKALRFGLFEVQPGQPQTNHTRIIGEYNDLVAVLGMLGLNVVDADRIRAKRDKIERFLVFSGHCGTLTESSRAEGLDPMLAALHPDAQVAPSSSASAGAPGPTPPGASHPTPPSGRRDTPD